MRIFSKRSNEFDFLEDFDPEFNLRFHKTYNASSLAKELYYLGFTDQSAIEEQFKIRNYEIDSEVKDIIKEVISMCEKSRGINER
jgi:hypothetical protein